jgi:hypothetical protein
MRTSCGISTPESGKIFFMSLQVRLRHALGERVLELPEREVSAPLIVGRGREADVQVPSISVAPQHCVLFIHEGQWVVQPMDGSLTLNGDTIVEPAALQIGDILALGNNASAPLLQIDPIGAAEGRTGPVMAAAVVPPASRPSLRPTNPTWGAPAPAPAPAPLTAPHHAYSAPPAPPQLQAAADAGYAEPGGEDAVDWNTATEESTTPTRRKYAARRQTSSQGAMVAVIVIGGIVFIGMIVWAYNATHQPPPPVVVEQAPPPKTVAKRPFKMFDIDGDQADARQMQTDKAAGKTAPPPPEPQPSAPADPAPASPSNTATPSEPASAAPAPSPSASSDAETASSKEPSGPPDPAWHGIELAHTDTRHQGLSIIQYDEYRRNNPGKNVAELNQYMDEAVNWLYWQRVAQLWKRRDDLAAQIKQKEMDLRNQPPGAFHTQLETEKADLTKKLNEATVSLTDDMAYTSDVPPDMESPTVLQKLSASRNAEKFEDFKRHVLKYVRTNHGSVWWDGEI